MKGEEEKEGGEERGAASSEEKFVLTIPAFHPSPPISRSPPPPRVGPPRRGKAGEGRRGERCPPSPPSEGERDDFQKKTSLRSFLHSSPPSPRRYVGSRASGRGSGLPGGRQEGAGCPPPTPAAGRGRGRGGAGQGQERERELRGRPLPSSPLRSLCCECSDSGESGERERKTLETAVPKNEGKN